MSTALKDLYSPAFFTRFSPFAQDIIPGFDPGLFRKKLFTAEWKQMELKARMRHIAQCLHPFMPASFKQAAKMLTALSDHLVANNMTGYGLECMFLPDYIEQYGLEDLPSATRAMEKITQFTSCEFAVRPFILRYPEAMIAQMQAWSLHKDEKVRRFSSEGIRPRLPWAMAIPFLKKDPAPILPILENLKDDPSAYVRKSVANNLNDISKDHPELMIRIARAWKGTGINTSGIIKHGSRTLLKAGHPAILKYYGLHKNESLVVSGFSISTPRVAWGGDLEFSFVVKNNGSKPLPLRLEYGLYFLRKNQQYSRKVFKISERILGPQESLQVRKKHSFRAITTRVYYTGKQQVAVIVNGNEYEKTPFSLLKMT